MALPKEQTLSVLEAVEHLADLAECQEHGTVRLPDWLAKRPPAEGKEALKQTFRKILSYMKEVVHKGDAELARIDTQRGLRAISSLVQEAVQKIELNQPLFAPMLEGSRVKELREYLDFKAFYMQEIERKFKAPPDEERPFKELLHRLGPENSSEIHYKGLDAIKLVTRDELYELFLVEGEDGEPLFSRSLLRHLKLLAQFDIAEIAMEGADPLLPLRKSLARTHLLRAQEIHQRIAYEADLFCQKSLARKENPMIAATAKALYALLLASNPDHLLPSAQKGPAAYFGNFEQFVREAIGTVEYMELSTIAEKQIPEELSITLRLLQTFSSQIFLPSTAPFSDCKQEALALLLAPSTEATSETGVVVEEIERSDGYLRKLFAALPNGPLLKTFALLEERGLLQGFDPLLQNNFPHPLFSLVGEELHVSCIHLPSPTQQDTLHKAEIVQEFPTFLSALGDKSCYLLINLQNRTGWRDFARCEAIEDLAAQPALDGKLLLLTLPATTPFSLQTEEYQSLNFDDFQSAFMQQLASQEECGYSFPKRWHLSDRSLFFQKAISWIHDHLFEARTELSQEERTLFVQIVQLFIALRCITLFRPALYSCSCKDGIDLGAPMAASLYALCHLLRGHKGLSTEERQHLLWILEGPAITLRERPLSEESFRRTSHALALLESSISRKAPRASLIQLLDGEFFNNIQIAH